MDHNSTPAYGLWTLVVINSLVFIIFALSFARPQNPRDWRSFGGFWLLSAAWTVLYRSQRNDTLATTGAYAWMRHPQYVAFVLIMFGFLLQWPTILTLAMFPVLCFMYVRLAIGEERDAHRVFGEEWARYAARTARFIPRLGGARQRQAHP